VKKAFRTGTIRGGNGSKKIDRGKKSQTTFLFFPRGASGLDGDPPVTQESGAGSSRREVKVTGQALAHSIKVHKVRNHKGGERSLTKPSVVRGGGGGGGGGGGLSLSDEIFREKGRIKGGGGLARFPSFFKKFHATTEKNLVRRPQTKEEPVGTSKLRRENAISFGPFRPAESQGVWPPSPDPEREDSRGGVKKSPVWR